ncbi:MAG: MMPL family transporter [Solirubrobacterales bacterium]|nr:MMPL family transporter [Solirubrobacterales bacterium]
MRRSTEFVLRHRRVVLLVWLVLFVLGVAGASNVGSLLSNRFSVPGSDAERGLSILRSRFHERSDGAFTLVAQSQGSPIDTAAIEAAAQRGAQVLSSGKAGPVLSAAPGVAYVQITTVLENAKASDRTTIVRRAVGTVPGARLYVTGFPAINHDTQPLYGQDLARGESIAVPIALIVLAFMFATLGGIAVPIAFAAITIPTTLGGVWIAANLMEMATYVTNIVSLIGIAIAIDYSMLVVFRFREELARQDDDREALLTTMATAGRATIFSGLTVAVGLALLAFMPLPFIRSMGVGGLLVPIVSVAASATLLPAMLSLLGRWINSLRIIPRRILAHRTASETGFWARLARTIMRRPWPILFASAAVMLALAVPAVGLHLTSGDHRGVPSGTEATQGLFVLERTLGPGALAPNQIVVDTGRPSGAFAPSVIAAEQRLVAELRADKAVDRTTVIAPAMLPPARARQANLLDPTGQIAQIRASGFSDSGTQQAVDLVHRIRDRYIPEAGFGAAHVLLTGAPAFGVDFLAKAYGAFPWLVLAVLVISYLLLLRAFRSVILPVKAVLMNLLSVGASYGVLVLFFQHGVGHDLLGLKSSPQIEGWIPIFLFAVLFGLSMDYEVFLLSRMREVWDESRNNEHAVAYGLEHTGRIITAAAIIMIAAFAGFTAGQFVGLQEFGIGLSAAILLDATIVRALLVPAAMKLLGQWNWFLPERVRRALRLAPASAR